MSSRNISITDHSTSDHSYEVLSNKETQTSIPYITDSFALVKGPSRPLPKGIDKSGVETAVNILDCKIIKDPSETGTPEFTESFIKEIENSKLSISDSSTSSNKGQPFNKEDVLPYLRPHLDRCEDAVDSLEKLIQDALEDKPCFEVYEGKKDIQDKISKSEVNSMDATPKSKDSQDDLERKNSSTAKSKNKSDNNSAPLPTSRSSSSDMKKSAKKSDAENNNEINDIKNRLSKESITKCVSDGLTALKRSASCCLEKMEVVIGMKRSENPDEKPTYYAMEKPKVESSASNNVQTETGNSLNSIKNLLNNPQERITNITATVKNVADKFYTKSKDAVTLITSESAKLLNKCKIGEKCENSIENNPEQKKENIKSINTNSLTNLIFQRAENKPIKELEGQSLKEEPPKKEIVTPPPRISDSLPPSIRAFKPRLCKIRDDIVDSKFERSSKYDTPMVKEVSNKLPEAPESRMPTVSAIDRTPDPPPPNMFTIIKSKIFSMFQNESENEEAQETIPDEEEEDPFERFIDQ